MTFLLGIFLIVLYFIAWMFWAILICTTFFLAIAIPWGIWEVFMYLTFNNVINWVSKIPTFIGWIIGFIFALPFAIPGLLISIWCYAQTLMMAILVLNGDPTSNYAKNYLDIVNVWEFENPGNMIIARFFYNHMQWLWGGASMFRGSYFWQNGVWINIGDELSPPFALLKLVVLCIPYTLIFLFPLMPLCWSIFRPILGACRKLPAISDNGTGRD